MNKPITTGKSIKWLQLLLTALLLIAFFIPWVSWEKNTVSGADLPKGNFFSISADSFGLSNPFPQFDFIIAGLWIVPVLATLTFVLALFNKKTSFTGTLAGILALSLVLLYILYTNVLKDLGVSYNYQIGIYITILAAAGIILAGSQRLPVKISLLLLGPLVTYIGFTAASRQLENQEFADTANTLSVHTVNALDLIREFHANDSLANTKYREKIVTVNGNISAIETPNDSTVNIKFIDTTGSYAIFPFHGETINDVKKLNKGDAVSVKGSCSGGVFSEILGIQSITFKRCTLNK